MVGQLAEIGGPEAAVAQVAEYPHVGCAKDHGDLHGMRHPILDWTLLGVESEIDLAAAGRSLAGSLPLERRRHEGRHGDPGILERPADMDDFLGLHAEEVASAYGAHVEAFQPLLVGKRDHF